MQLVKWNYLEDCTVFEVIHFTNLCRSASSLHMQRSCPFISDTNAHQAFTCGGARPAAPSFARNGHACPVPTHAAHPRHVWQTPSSSNTIPPAHAMRKAVPRLTWHRPREAVRQALPHVAYHRLVNVDVSQATSEPATVRVCVA